MRPFCCLKPVSVKVIERSIVGIVSVSVPERRSADGVYV
jgi:hypothetical protein